MVAGEGGGRSLCLARPLCINAMRAFFRFFSEGDGQCRIGQVLALPLGR